MVIDSAPAVTGTQLGYARVSTPHQSLDQQMDALTAAGVDATRVYTDKLSGTSTRQQRPGLAALLDYARQGDAIVVVGIDRLGRNAAEVMTTIRDLGEGQDSGHHAARGVRGVDACRAAFLAQFQFQFGQRRASTNSSTVSPGCRSQLTGAITPPSAVVLPGK